MMLLACYFVLAVFVNVSCSFELNIKTIDNILVKLSSNDYQDYRFEEFCMAKFYTMASQDKIKDVDQMINNMKQLDVDMPWLVPDYHHKVCFHKTCGKVNQASPICKKYLVPRVLSCDIKQTSIKVNFDPSYSHAAEFQVTIYHQDREVSRQTIKTPGASAEFNNLIPGSLYRFTITALAIENSDPLDMAYEVDCQTKEKEIGEINKVPGPHEPGLRQRVNELKEVIKTLSFKIDVIIVIVGLIIVTMVVSIIIGYLYMKKVLKWKGKEKGRFNYLEFPRHKNEAYPFNDARYVGDALERLGRPGAESDKSELRKRNVEDKKDKD